MKKLTNFYYYFFTAFLPFWLTHTKTLDELGLQFGTDKSSVAHNYTKIYKKYFESIRHKPLKILEIGFLNGASARMWDHYFTHPKTKIYFIDINPDTFSHLKHLSNRCSLYMVDQADEKQLSEFIKTTGGDFDLIIDDGGHTMIQQITGFKVLFPAVKKGGIYVIEDLHTSYWQSHGSEGTAAHPKASSHSAIRFLQKLVDDVNFVSARTGYAHRSKYLPLLKNLTIYQKEIESLHFYTSLCFIIKG